MSSTASLQGWWEIGGRPVTGLFAISPNIAGGMSFLAIITRITGSPLNQIVYYSLIPIPAAATVYFLAKTLISHDLAVVSAALVAIIVGDFYNFHEYVFGRYALFPLCLAAIIHYAKTGKNRYLWIFLVGVLPLKFSAPGTEVVLVGAAIAVRVALPYTNQAIRSKATGQVALLVVVIFLAVNPKLYFGVFSGLSQTGGPITLQPGSTSLTAQAGDVLSQLRGMITGSSEIVHPLEYSARSREPLSRLRTYGTLTLVLLTAVYGIHMSGVSLKRQSLSFEFMVVAAMVAAVSVNTALRGLLLGRFGSKGLMVILTVTAAVALSQYVSKKRAVSTFVIICLVISVGVLAGHGPVTQEFSTDTAHSTAKWQNQYLREYQTILTDFKTYGNLGYYYAEQDVKQYWDRFEFVDYTINRYGSLLNGSGLNADYYVVDLDLDKPIKPQSYNRYQPLGTNLEPIVYKNQFNQIYDNGEHAVYH